MKKNLRFLFLIFLLCGGLLLNCSTKQKSNLSKTNEQKIDTLIIANDSLEYELIIMDIGFNSWLATQRPRGYFTQKYMEIRNQQFVTAYNIRFRNPQQYDRDLYPFEIEYRPLIDYGYEVNYLLYHYFLFFEEKYNQKLR